MNEAAQQDDTTDAPLYPDDADDERPVGDQSIPAKPRCTAPNAYTLNLYRDWRALVPNLVEPLALYQKNSVTNAEPSPSFCNRSTCNGIHEQRRLTCLYWNQPRVAVSIDLLNLYQALLEQSGTSNSAFCAALQEFYTGRGFCFLDAMGAPIHEPFRRGFGYAAKWYRCVKIELDHEVNRILSDSRGRIPDMFDDVPSTTQYTSPAAMNYPSISLQRGRASELLQQRCPACFGGTRFGQSFNEGGDVHVAVDCNFHHRHRTSAGDCPEFYDPEFFLSKREVDEAGLRIENARKSAKKRYSPKIPDIAVDEDEKSFEAADEKKEKTHGGRYDDRGLAALVCRHDVPLFLANVDTPGEQQKYAVALLDRLASNLPEAATIAVLYDIGCVMDRSVNLYDIFVPALMERLLFAMSAMHAYGHQWACQLVYNPRLRSGLGLTDGEGVECFWSRIRKLIGITRSSGRRQRIYLLDRQASFTAQSIRDDLGGWIRRKLKEGVEKKGAKARADLESCGKAIAYLRQQWDDQRQTQTSIRSHAPAQLKRELDAVLTLQAHADTVETAIQVARETLLSTPNHIKHLLSIDLSQLSYIHTQLCTQIEQLYTSLNVGQTFPELADLDVTFVRTLLLARDLKMNIRKRAIGTFFEWDRLDQATGGREQALSTKLHQQTRKSISRRKPALMAAIRKFNEYVEQLEHLANENKIKFPLPRRLSTELAHLKNSDDLLQDVWIQAIPTEAPAWLVDANIRQGIRAMLQLDRCLEERRRLGHEADHLLSWLECELASIFHLNFEVAFSLRSIDSPFRFPLQRRYERTCVLQHRWKNPLLSDLRLHSIVRTAPETAYAICHRSSSSTIRFVSPTVVSIPDFNLDTPHFVIDSIPPENDYDDQDDPEEIMSNDESECLADVLDDLDLTPSPSNVTWEVPLYSEDDALSMTSDFSNSPSREGSIIHTVLFDAQTLRRLYTPTALLNDDAMNGCAVLLSDAFPNPQAIVFSTYDLAALRNESQSETIWRYTRKLKFWMHAQWIIPIHHKHMIHWTVATVNLQMKTFDLFDSLADDYESERDIQVSLGYSLLMFPKLIVSPSSLGASRRLDVLYLIQTVPIQHNGYDCGVWVLSQIRASLHGYRQTAITEVDISRFREHCLGMVLSLSTWNVS
ncbi:hypothetical protein ARMSODRAFT_883693 [Armillaria solidipes]|uniref:Ubiquitin-like protease family profile domain-containing protein n=1 Tax=Armillaria solidipes TaxID=1076256 RepID=A0A2H3BZB2_9AGAR|nr:hypothetical protein ARMSODRAFT_883693 [Armillaria solidipes]